MKQKIQVLTDDEDEWNSKLWSLLEGHGFSVVAAPERKSPRNKGNIRSKVSPSGIEGRGIESGADAAPQGLDEAAGDISERVPRPRRGSSSVLPFPLQALACGILLPLVVVEWVWTLTYRCSASALAGFFGGVAGFASHKPWWTAVAPSQKSGARNRGLPR